METRYQILCKIGECVGRMPSEFSLAFRQELIRKFGDELRVGFTFVNNDGKFAHLHARILTYKPNNEKIEAIRYLREMAEPEYGKLGLLYAKKYVEWVWGREACEPAF